MSGVHHRRHVERNRDRRAFHGVTPTTDAQEDGGAVLRVFETFVEVDGLRLQRALLASHGPEMGADLYADVMAKAWGEWDRIGRMSNPAGYLWQVAKSEARRYTRWNRKPFFPGRLPAMQTEFTSRDLFLSLGVLSHGERVAVVMVHAHNATYQEVAELLDVPVTTVTNLVHRGLNRLRQEFKDPQ
jgi:DNA-directed RNA polymerase specialized sigma24 family protein